MRAILTYHSIDDSGSPISVSREQLRAHCRFLISGRVRVLPLRELVRRPDGDDAVALTFDDAFANFRTAAMPELASHGLPATVFVVSDKVGTHNDWGGEPAAGIPHLPLMTWDDLEWVADRGFEVGAHTRKHRWLPRVSANRIEDEIAGSARVIGQRLGGSPRSFAYPYGATDERSVRVVRSTFEVGCTTELRRLRPEEDAAILPRIDMYYLRSEGQLERWGSAAFRSMLWLRARGRNVRALLGAGSRPGRIA
jgi:peptidoglycan/xylan/chitin deacetylase (PgdA/CDA1 family)